MYVDHTGLVSLFTAQMNKFHFLMVNVSYRWKEQALFISIDRVSKLSGYNMLHS